jgi:hypothetical protein
MKRTFFAIILSAAISGAAFAQSAVSTVVLNQNQQQNNKAPHKPSHSGGGGKHKDDHKPEQSQRQQHQQQQGQAQSQVATGGNAQQSQSATANNAGNVQSSDTSVNTTYKQVRQAPMAYAPDAYPSAPCRVSGSAGVSSPVGGVSLGGSKMDNECDKRETARAFALLGNQEAAAKILCETKAAKAAHLTMDDCLKMAPVQIKDEAQVESKPLPPVPLIFSPLILTPAPVTQLVPPIPPEPPTNLIAKKTEMHPKVVHHTVLKKKSQTTCPQVAAK